MSKNVIILASFGTTVPEALNSIFNIQKKVTEYFPNTPIKLTFTSNIIRKIWKNRKKEKEKWLNKGIPLEILNIKGIIGTIGDAIEEEYENIIVQPTHIFYMEQVHDLYSYVKAFQSIKTMQKKWMPFKKIVMSRPALGMFSENFYYKEDIKKALYTLKLDVNLAKEKNATLFYMAHGNEKFPLGIFYEIEALFNKLYPHVNTVFACVEGTPSFEEAIEKIKNKNIILKPFMIVAGVHAKEDMNEWKEKLKTKGFSVETIMEGLGTIDEFAKIFANHIKDTATIHKINLN